MNSRIIFICLFFFYSGVLPAEQQLFMTRSSQAFPETMSLLQSVIASHGYTVSRVQHVDKGLTSSGFKTDTYRIVFFGNAEELHQLSEQHPELIPYLPLQIAIFAEADETVLVASNPQILAELYPEPRLRPLFKRWHDDMANIFLAMQNPD